MRQLKVVVYCVTLAVGLTLGGAGLSQTSNDRPVRRLVLDPAAFVVKRADAPIESKARGFKGQAIALGPQIELKRPTDAVFPPGAPVEVHVEFLPGEDGSEPDMSTLNVWVQKKTWLGWFGQDITERVIPFVEGRAVHVQEMDFSGYTGDFQFNISISNGEDRKSEKMFEVTIRKA